MGGIRIEEVDAGDGVLMERESVRESAGSLLWAIMERV
jgi:hypothetical protein